MKDAALDSILDKPKDSNTQYLCLKCKKGHYIIKKVNGWDKYRCDKCYHTFLVPL